MRKTVIWLISVGILTGETGSRACAPCHPAIYKSYMSTAMAQSSGGITKSEFPAGASAKVRVFSEGGRFGFTIEDGGTVIRRTLDYFVGAGLAGRSYLSAIDGFLYQAPVSYYSSQRRWDISPGFEKQDRLSLTRAVEPACLRCHSSRLQPLPGTANGYGNPPFLEGGVSCERCHGPGEGHIAEIKTAAIVHPGKLDARRRDSICAQCHLSGVTEIARKNASGIYQPGRLLTDSSTVFVWSRGGTLNANSHFERMTQSACWQASDRKLWCGSCHDAHTRPATATKASYYRARCLQCHTQSSCKEQRKVRIAAKDNCLQCHMPRTEMPTVRHAAATDHSIPRRPGGKEREAAHSGILVPFDGIATDRELGLAYADVALKDENRQLGMRAYPLLRQAYEADPADSRVGVQLAQLYDRMGNEAKACEIYGSIVNADVNADANAIAAAVNLGACLAKRGQTDESIRLWISALKRSPSLAAARTNLAVALLNAGEVQQAKRVLEEGLKIDPLSKTFADLLRQTNPVQ